MSTAILKQTSGNVLAQISSLVEQLSDDDYSRPVGLLNGNAIAKHIRHVLELYVELIKGIKDKEINYDQRERNLLIEHNRHYALTFIDELLQKIRQVEKDEDVSILSTIEENEVSVQSTINRELSYNIEHAIHHMAIIRIAIRQEMPYIEVDENFGVAYSTIKFHKRHVHGNVSSG